MSNAHSYWGSACDSDADYCNGNNDGVISNSLTEAVQAQETVRAWQHMSLAGVLSETDTAERDSDLFPIPGVGVPESAYSGNDGEGPTTWDMITGGARHAGWVHWPTNEYRVKAPSDAITTNDAYLMDSKVDDGIRDTGKVRANNGKRDIWYWSTNCNSGSDPSGYNIGYDQNACQMSFFY